MATPLLLELTDKMAMPPLLGLTGKAVIHPLLELTVKLFMHRSLELTGMKATPPLQAYLTYSDQYSKLN